MRALAPGKYNNNAFAGPAKIIPLNRSLRAHTSVFCVFRSLLSVYLFFTRPSAFPGRILLLSPGIIPEREREKRGAGGSPAGFFKGFGREREEARTNAILVAASLRFSYSLGASVCLSAGSFFLRCATV